MSKIDELKRVYIDELCASGGDVSAGIAAVVRALRDELTSVSRLRDVQRVFEEILAPREGGSREAGEATRADNSAPLPAAPAPVCEWTYKPYEVAMPPTSCVEAISVFLGDKWVCTGCLQPISLKTEAQR